MILAFAGAIGSGKTRLSTAVAERLGWARVSFGDHLRAVAAERGEPAFREHLQVLGDTLIAQGWTPFCEGVLARAHWTQEMSLVIDGVRHIEALVTLRAVCAPALVSLLYVSTSPEVRHLRLAERDQILPQDLGRFEEHGSEGQADQLRAHASLVLDGRRPVEELVDEIRTWKGDSATDG